MADHQRVLVTGASGYIAMHTIVQLLQEGYQVRGTVRSLTKEARIRNIFSEHIVSDAQFECVVADLLDDAGWQSAMQEIDCVLHIASPNASTDAKSEDYYIKPAVDGTLRILQFAHQADIRRVVMTSSVAAILNKENLRNDKIWSEADWGNPNNAMSAYAKSKILAERAAWDFARQYPELELVALNPGFTLGRVFDEHFSPSLLVIVALLKREMPMLPNVGFPVVHVGDVARAHINAITHPDAAGERFALVDRFMWFQEVAKLLNESFAAAGITAPTDTMPDWMVRGMALFMKNLREVVGTLGYRTEFDNSKMQNLLDTEPISAHQAIIDAAESLIDQGVTAQ